MTASHPTEPNAMRTALGHKERFPPRRLSGRCGIEIGRWRSMLMSRRRRLWGHVLGLILIREASGSKRALTAG